MAGIPRLRTRSNRRNINIVVDERIDELYRLAKQNGYDSSEIARKAVSEAFDKIEEQIKRPVS